METLFVRWEDFNEKYPSVLAQARYVDIVLYNVRAGWNIAILLHFTCKHARKQSNVM